MSSAPEFGTWSTTSARLVEHMGAGATDRDATNMAALLSARSYTTALGTTDSASDKRTLVPDEVWETCLRAALAYRVK